MKPFLKWAGNKYRIVEQIKKTLPSGGRLIEPFVGAGAVFLNTHYEKYLLADLNADLIFLYSFLKKEGASFIQDCKLFFSSENNNEKKFYEIRDLFNTTEDSRLKSLLFVYLNKHGFNGLCRYNAAGKFNVPWGKYKKPYFPEKEMKSFYYHAKNALFECADFEKIMHSACVGDVIYCDPPYVPLSETAHFTNYTAHVFGVEQQLKLASLAEALQNKGISVVISNHDTDFTRKIYAKAEILQFQVRRFISCDGNNRVRVPELLALF